MDENIPLTTEAAEDMHRRVAHVIEQIRPAIQADGGDIELVEVTAQSVARIRFHGACITCPSRLITLKSGIEHSVMEHVPEISGVEQVN